MVDEKESPPVGTITEDELESEEWNTERERLETATRDAAIAMLRHTRCRACALPFVHNGLAMIVSVGLPVDVLMTTVESMKMFVQKHEDDMITAMSVLVGSTIARDGDDGSEEESETSH